MKSKRIFTLMLALVMTLSLLPTTAWAVQPSPAITEQTLTEQTAEEPSAAEETTPAEVQPAAESADTALTDDNSFLLFAAAKSLAAYNFAGAVAGVSYALGSMVPASLLMRRWFRAPSGLAIGICSAGTGLAAVVFSPLFTAIAESSGVDRAFLWTAAFCAAAAVLVFFLIRSGHAALGLEPWGKAAPECRPFCWSAASARRAKPI